MHDQESARHQARVEISQRGMERSVKIAIQVNKTVRCARGQLFGCVGEISLDEADVSITHQVTNSLQRSLRERDFHVDVNACQILLRKTLISIEKIGRSAEMPSHLR